MREAEAVHVLAPFAETNSLDAGLAFDFTPNP